MTAADASSEALTAGTAALERCAWQEARAAFERALDAGAGPEALEGLGLAAFFLDEAAVALDARERAYAEYRAADRPVDAARVATALAWDYRTARGEKAVSDGWLARARRLLHGCAAAPESGWLALREASFALPGDTGLARERCAEAEELGRRLGDLDLEMTAIALDGLTRVSEGDVAAGMARLDEATTAATAGEMRDPMAIGFSCCFLIFACERVRDFDRAGQWCERLAEMTEEWNIRALRAVCRAHYGMVLLLRGEWSTAEGELTRAAAVMTRHAGESADALARLAELRRRQGRVDEAMALIERAEHHPIAVLCRGSIALERGEVTEAAESAARFLRMVSGARTERAAGLELMAEACAAADRIEAANASAAELRAIAEAAGTDPLLGAARHAEGHASLAAGAFDDAREAFEDAVELLGRARLPFEAARARVSLARALQALGREDAARLELDRSRATFAALGASDAERRTTLVPKSPATLTAREREVLALVAQGRTNAEIAAALVLSEHTVHRHVANILAKLGAPSRAAAVASAAERGLL